MRIHLDVQSRSSSLASPSSLDLRATSQLSSDRPTDTPSELDLLFSKLDPAASAAEATSHASPKMTAYSINQHNQSTTMTVQGLLGTIARPDPFPGRTVKPASPQPEIPVPNRGLTLLNKIFASASPSPDPSPIHHGHTQSTKNLSLSTNQSLATSSSTHPSIQPSSPSRPSQHSTETTPLVFSRLQHHPSDSQSSHTFLSKQSSQSDSSPSLSDPTPHHVPALGGHSWSSDSSPVLQVLTQEVIFGLLGLSSETKSLASYTHTRSSPTSTSSSRLSPYSASSSQIPSIPDVGAKSVLATNGELWPDSRGPIDDRALDDDADILELDFADTSALSSADAFMNMIQQKEKTRKVSASVAISPGGNSPSHLQQNCIQPSRPQAEITLAGALVSSPLGSRVNADQSASLGISVNGDTHKASLPSSSPVSPPSNCANHDRPNGKHIPNGRVTVKGQGVQLDRSAVQQAIHTVTPPGRLPSIAERNEFVRELLTLVHVSTVSVVLQA